MLIRRANADDAPAILALAPRLVAFGPPPWREQAAMTETDRDVIAQAIRSTAEDPTVFVADVEGTIAGFIHVRSLEDYYRRRRHGHVADIVVAEDYQGQGIATALLARAEDWSRAQGYDWMTLGVFE